MGFLSKLLHRGGPVPLPEVDPPAEEAAPTPPLLLDHRERACGLHDALLREGLQPEVRTLETGDVILHGFLAVERKTAADFAVSLKDGRLFDQIARLSDDYQDVAVLLEGDFTREAVGEMDGRALRGALLSLQMDWHLPVLRSRDVGDSARTIGQLLAWAEKRFHPSRLPRNRGPRGLAAANPVEAMLLALPGIGPARAKVLAEAYPDMGALLLASPKDLVQLDGIGSDGAGRLWDLLHQRRV